MLVFFFSLSIRSNSLLLFNPVLMQFIAPPLIQFSSLPSSPLSFPIAAKPFPHFPVLHYGAVCTVMTVLLALVEERLSSPTCGAEQMFKQKPESLIFSSSNPKPHLSARSTAATAGLNRYIIVPTQL